MREHDRWQRDGDDGGRGGALAPGKRSLTQGLPGRGGAAASLLGQERDVVSFDASSDYREDRATIDAPHRGPLSDAQLERARVRNPHWARTLGFDPRTFSLGAVDSAVFAEDVARHQAEAELPVDGIAGPRTARTFADRRPASRARPDAPGAPGLRGQARDVVSFDRSSDYVEARATIAGPPAAPDDSFALHRIDL